MRRRRWWAAAGGVAVVVAAIAIVRGRSGSRSAAGGGSAPEAQAARVVPVTVAPAARRDVPIWLEGLGNLAALKTVTVRTQVDGRLQALLFEDGQAVRTGQVLAQIDPRPFQAQLHQAEGALARDEAQLRNARINVARDRELVAQKLIAPQQLDADVAAAGQLEGAVRMDEAAIETARLNLEYARIVSPIDGVAGIRLIDPGNVVHPNDASGIVVVTQIDPIAVLFTLPQDQLPAVAGRAAAGKLAVDAYGRDGATLLASGELSAIDNQINPATATFRLKALLPNPRRLLWPNQFVNARLRIETRSGALVVPAPAVQRGPSGTFVYVVGPDEAVSARPVTVDGVQGDVAIVAQGLAEGDRVVTDGQNQLRPGAKVQARPPAGAGDGRGPPGGPDRGAQGPPRVQGREGAPTASDGRDAGKQGGAGR